MTNELADLERMRISPAEETKLIARAQAGDVEAFCELASNHRRSLYILALKYSGNHHDAEDLTQDVLFNAYRAIRQFKRMSSFHTWLSRIMVNSFLNEKRKSDPLASSDRHTTTDEVFEATYSVSRPGHTERRINNELLAQQILETLQAVPERQRLMFLMKHQEGMTCEEIADTMGIAVGTVKKTLFRVVDRLRQRFVAPAALRTATKG
jgi:RNA polymerase sigma-70 factor (ECF subfamily)